MQSSTDNNNIFGSYLFGGLAFNREEKALFSHDPAWYMCLLNKPG